MAFFTFPAVDTPHQVQESTSEDVRITPPELKYVPEVSPWILFGGVYIVASIGGLGALLRSGQSLTKRHIFSAIINSGVVGLIIALSLWKRLGTTDPLLVLGLSAFAGLGGATTLDIAFLYIRKRLGVSAETPKEPGDPKE